MATLVNCTTADFRERMLRWIFLNEPPPWEKQTGGSPMSWPVNTIVAAAHETADPGESGGVSTNEATFSGYARQTLARSAVDFGILGSGSSTPSLQVKGKVTFGPNGEGSTRSVYAISYALRHSGTDYGIGRYVPGSPWDVLSGAVLNFAGGSAKIALDVSIGGTSAAAFDSWEEAFAKYVAYGGAVYSGSFPGLTTGLGNPAWVALSKTDPRSSLTYPNVFRTVLAANATYEPTQGEYETYYPVSAPRAESNPNGLEAVETSSGVWKVRNKVQLDFPDAETNSTGETFPYAVLAFQGVDAAVSSNLYAVAVQELDTPYVVPSGGTGGLQIPAQSLEWEIR